MSTSPRRRSWIIIAALLVLPLIIGAALAAATGLDPARSWNADEEPAAAPVAASPSGIDPASLSTPAAPPARPAPRPGSSPPAPNSSPKASVR